jgi:acetyl-CoA synthetase
MATTVWGDHSRFLETYFSTWPDVWRHGDRASFDADGFWTLHGRSDDVMNVAGKRLGPVEVESAALSVAEVRQAAAVGLPHDTKGETVALFVVLSGGGPLTESVRREISSAVIASLGKAFAPSVIIAVPDLPRTRTAKTVRRAIRAICLGQDPGDLSTVDNPEVLRHFPRLTFPDLALDNDENK